MIVSIRKWTSLIGFIIVFALVLLLVSGGYRWLADAVSPVHPYKEPTGDSVKVFVTDRPHPTAARPPISCAGSIGTANEL